MYRIARKYFLPILLGSALVFAISLAEVNASTMSSNCTTINLDNGQFWSKFRDSVMKDKPDSNSASKPPKGEDSNSKHEPPLHK